MSFAGRGRGLGLQGLLMGFMGGEGCMALVEEGEGDYEQGRKGGGLGWAFCGDDRIGLTI